MLHHRRFDGRRVYKNFPRSQGYYSGTVEYDAERHAEKPDDPCVYLVTYDDGDTEHVALDELTDILRGKKRERSPRAPVTGARALGVCDACKAAGRGVKYCCLDQQHAGGTIPRGFREFVAGIAGRCARPEGPPADAAAARCAAVHAANTGVDPPPCFVKTLTDFADRNSKETTVIQGGRRSVYVDGDQSGPFQTYAEGGYANGGAGSNMKSRRTHAPKFLERCRNAIAYRAAHLWPEADLIQLSRDMICLIGAPSAQVPHVDLIPNQCQAVLALNRQAPTLVLRADAAPTVAEAFAATGIDKDSQSKWAGLLRAAPALALTRDKINAAMVDATRFRGGADDRPVSRDAWDGGSLFLADHRLVHAGPRCTLGQRVVLFTTLTVQSGDQEPVGYDPRDQYMPYFLAEDPTMPPERARDLLMAWAQEKPWDHYPDKGQSDAVKDIATKGRTLSPEKLAALVAKIRASHDE